MWRRTGGSLSGWIAFIGSLVFYVRSLAPGIEYWDTGEMQTVPQALFIAHPTGFPFFVLTGWLFSHALPFGDPAWRLSLFSAIAVAAAAAMLALFVYELTKNAYASAGAGLAFAPVGIVWRTAERADPHDLALLCSSLCLLHALRAGERRDARFLPVAAIAWGAAVATHPVALFALPAAIAFAWPALAPLRYGDLGRLTLACFAPVALYLYVPLRSGMIERFGLDPNVALGLRGTALVDDGAPATMAAFARYILATRFLPGRAFASFVHGTGSATALGFAHELAYGAYGILALAVAVVGFGVLVRQRSRVALGLAFVAIGGIAFAANYAVESSPERYALAACWAISVCCGFGAWWLVVSIVQIPRAIGVVTLALLALCVWPTYARAASLVAYREYRGDARDEAFEVVAATSDGSVVVASWSFATPLAYAKYVSNTLGTRYIVSGWPTDYESSYATWRKRYGHVYFVIEGDVARLPFTRQLYVAPHRRWVLYEYGA